MLRYITLGLLLILFGFSLIARHDVAAVQGFPRCVPAADNYPSLDLNAALPDDDFLGAEPWQTMVPDYLNTGGDPFLFEDALADAALNFESDFITDGVELRGYWRSDLFVENVIGDAPEEIIIDLSLGDPFDQGSIFVFECVDDAFQSHLVGSYAMPTSQFRSLDVGLMEVLDLTGDDASEILMHIITNVSAGGDTTQRYYVSSWNPTTEAFEIISPLQEAVEDATVLSAARSAIFTENGDLQLIDTNRDSIYELSVTKPPFRHNNSLEWSRLDRAQITDWSWTGETFEVTCNRRADFPRYRIQALEDATNTIQCGGDVEMAIRLTEGALSGERLMFWTIGDNNCGGCDPDREETALSMIAVQQEIAEDAAAERGDPPPNEVWEAELEAYATFRLAILHDAVGDVEAAELMQSDLDENFPDSGFQDLISMFRNTAAESDAPDYAAICAEINALAAERGITTPFPKYFYGVATPDGIDEPICPF